MSAATALVTGPEAVPALAEAAVRRALERASLAQARGVLLFLSADFVRHAQGAVVAAARAAGTLQVFGMVVSGLFSDQGWSLDQPAAAALVIGEGLALALPGAGDAPLLAFAGTPTLPEFWHGGPSRHGLLYASAPVWHQGRLAENGRAEAALAGSTVRAAVSTGLKPLTPPLAVEGSRGYDVGRVGGLPAADSLRRALPAELRDRTPLPLHLLAALPPEGPPVPMVAANPDGSLTLAAPFTPGDTIAWAVRQPLSAAADMAAALEAAACPAPAFALMFSCIGRGPLFYGDDDRDLLAFRRRFPGVPLLGAYGSGQIAPAGKSNHTWQNSVVTLLFEESHV